jgi:ELP3 family radical SAM enzyme/protein acetyltransferase
MHDIEDTILKYNQDTKECDEEIVIQLLHHLKTWIIDSYTKYKDSKKEKEIIHKLRNEIPKVMQKFLRPYKIQIKKASLLYRYKQLREENKIEPIDVLSLLLIKKPANDISGINQITILTSPTPSGQDFSCKHDCFYCPNEPAHEDNNWTPQPRSYLSKEPAVQRANRNHFHPYEQTKNRLDSLYMCGHKCDKLEFIIEGGTFTEYPKHYLKWFFIQFIYCVNVYFDSSPKREPKTLEEEIQLNTTAKCRIIGICIETRPDAVLENDEDNIPWLKTLLCWGVTRIQLGLQQIDNFILKKINRGHTVEQAIKAIEICKNNCFKIDMHLMPDLPYSNPEKDKYMFDQVYNSDKYQPDQIKIYPCEVVPWTKIEKWYNEGSYKPYGEDKSLMTDVLQYAMTTCKPWIRLPRVIRDIPDTYISGGIKCGNMRQVVNDKIYDEKQYSMDIRYREIERHPEYDNNDARLFVREYRASNGTEYFISFESYDKKAIYGFLRLRIPDTNDTMTQLMYQDTLKNKALIRELHVYGSVQNVGHFNTLTNASSTECQHSGFGKKLLKKAEQIAFWKGMDGLVIISGIGVRDYYKKRGYTYRNNYMVKHFQYKYLIYVYFRAFITTAFFFVIIQYGLLASLYTNRTSCDAIG